MKISERLELHRIRDGYYQSEPGEPYGAFRVRGPAGRELLIMADDGAQTGWDHVSVSTKTHTPNWREMCFVKSLFWLPEDCVVQFHPPASTYVNNMANCLHLWRWRKGEFPTPPAILVGYKKLGELKV